MSRPQRPPTLATPDADGVGIITIGTAVWAVAFVVLLPFRERLADAGQDTWIWIAATGFGLGLVGIWIVRRRRARSGRGG